jgi:hypothetical protein
MIGNLGKRRRLPRLREEFHDLQDVGGLANDHGEACVLIQSMIRKSVKWFSEKIMLKQ